MAVGLVFSDGSKHSIYDHKKHKSNQSLEIPEQGSTILLSISNNH